jgi:hypothetical protein
LLSFSESGAFAVELPSQTIDLFGELCQVVGSVLRGLHHLITDALSMSEDLFFDLLSSSREGGEGSELTSSMAMPRSRLISSADDSAIFWRLTVQASTSRLIVVSNADRRRFVI